MMSVEADTTLPAMMERSKAEILGALIDEPMEVHKVAALRYRGSCIMGSSFSCPAESTNNS